MPAVGSEEIAGFFEPEGHSCALGLSRVDAADDAFDRVAVRLESAAVA